MRRYRQEKEKRQKVTLKAFIKISPALFLFFLYLDKGFNSEYIASRYVPRASLQYPSLRPVMFHMKINKQWIIDGRAPVDTERCGGMCLEYNESDNRPKTRELTISIGIPYSISPNIAILDQKIAFRILPDEGKPAMERKIFVTIDRHGYEARIENRLESDRAMRTDVTICPSEPYSFLLENVGTKSGIGRLAVMFKDII